ncbi:unnamed protein product [Phytophthora lilii]|uniref:Unnamed protein product n=1 Tax=Phytophthora lilii TaxID=2077276 RepID=A0A9W6WXI7_9STRA|nr:unnamed protein product [Phytophthora lilii]
MHLHSWCPYVVLVGYLAKSLCGFDTWMTSDPLKEILSRNAPVLPSLCYSASFPLPSMNETTSFISDFSRAVDDGSAKSALELAVLEAWPSFQREHKFASVQLVRGSAPSVNIKAEYFEAWVARSSNAEQPWKTDLSVSEVQRDVFVVMSIAQEVNFDKLQYTLLQQAGKPVEAWSPHQQEIQSAAIPPLVQTNIAGAGFHRRYVMDVKIPSNACGKKSASKAIIVRVPIASTAYLDLDEIRVSGRIVLH